MPLLSWDQIDQITASEKPPRLIHAQALLETDVPGTRTFAVQIRGNSMQALFREGETIFVNPDLSGKADDDVVCESDDGRPGQALLRQLKEIDGQAILHPLNRRYKDLRVTKQPRILGRVVRLRKNL